MRIRSTKPEFWRSKTIAQLPWDVRLVLKGLESYVDDNGVGKDDLALIAADVFPRDLSRDPRETLARLSEAISTIAAEGLIARYTIRGEDLLYIDKWKDIQRIDKPGKGRFPRPDGTTEYAEPVDRESYGKTRESFANPPETLAPVTGEQGNSGAGEQGQDDVPLPPEPPVDDWVAAEVVDNAPKVVDNPSKPAKRYASQASKSVVRQELGTTYSDSAINRLGAQVENLSRQGKPDHLIREALREWQRRPNCDRPEYLPTVYDDIVKAQHATPGANGHDDKVNSYLAFATPTQNHLEIEK